MGAGRGPVFVVPVLLREREFPALLAALPENQVVAVELALFDEVIVVQHSESAVEWLVVQSAFSEKSLQVFCVCNCVNQKLLPKTRQHPLR